MIARAKRMPPSAIGSAATMPAATRSIGSWLPMSPVLETATCSGRRPSRFAASRDIASASTSGVKRGPVKAHRLGKAEHEVHVLYRLARRSLHQIIDGADDDQPLRPLVDDRVHEADVRARGVLRLRRRIDDADEGLVGVE